MGVGWAGDDGGRGQGAAGPPVLTAGRAQVGGKCVMPYPGNAWQHPKIHQSPDCLHLGGWHDVAGAPPRLCMVSAGLHPVTGLPRHS